MSSRRLAGGLERREVSHRRRLLAGLIVLVVLAVGPLLLDHMPIGLADSLAGRNHLWALCMVALHSVLEPVHRLFHLLIVAGLGFAAVDRIRALVLARRVFASLPWHVPDAASPLYRAAHQAGVDPADLRVIPGLADPAFTAGSLHPRIYVAAGLPDRLSEPELVAVLTHEAAHMRRRDPLRLSCLRFLACALFWLPAMRRLAEDLRDEVEIAADDAARTDPVALASALLALATWTPAGSLRLVNGVGFRRADLLDRRVRRLAGTAADPRSRVTWRSAGVSIMVLFLGLTAAAAVSHPLEGQHEAQEHCDHQGMMALLHLFCSTAGMDGDVCPHAGRHPS